MAEITEDHDATARANGWDGFRSFGRRVEGSGWEFTCDGMPTLMGCGAAVYVTRRWSKVGAKSSGWLVTYGMKPKPPYGEDTPIDEPEKWTHDRLVVLAYCPSCRVEVERQQAEWNDLLKQRVAAQRAEAKAAEAAARPRRRAPAGSGPQRKRAHEVTRRECPVCHEQVAVTPGGALRKHPKPPADPCAGATSHAERRRAPAKRAPQPPAAERAPQPQAPPEEPYVAPEPIVVEPGLYRSGETMLDSALTPPPGYGVLRIIAHVPLAEGRTGMEEAALLYEDPGYLSQVLDAVPNERIEILLRVEG